MENAVDALKMAGSVLLFVLALSLIIPLFTQARTTSDAIMSYVDRQGDTVGAGDENDDLFYYTADNSAPKDYRYVGIETIIPTIYQSIKEDFKVVFCKGNIDTPFFLYTYFGSNNRDWGNSGKEIKLNRIDLSYSSYASQGKSEEFLKGIIYGDYTAAGSLLNFEKKTFNVDIESSLESGGIYGAVVGKKVREYIGTYYQEDIDLKSGKKTVEPPESDKDKKRIVTYVIE